MNKLGAYGGQHLHPGAGSQGTDLPLDGGAASENEALSLAANAQTIH